MAVKTYSTKLGDTWDTISLLMYGTEVLVSELISANWQYRDVAVFSASVALVVPEVTQAQRDSANLPPWRRRQ